MKTNINKVSSEMKWTFIVGLRKINIIKLKLSIIIIKRCYNFTRDTDILGVVVMDRNNLKQQIEFIYDDMYINSPWTIVKLQSYLEFILKDIAKTIKIDYKERELWSLIKNVIEDYYQFENYNVFYKLNSKANTLKHDLANATLTFEIDFIRECISSLNYLIEKHYKDENKFLLLEDLTIEREIDIKEVGQLLEYEIRKKHFTVDQPDHIFYFSIKVSEKDPRFKIMGLNQQLFVEKNYNETIYAVIYGILTRTSYFKEEYYFDKLEKEIGKVVNKRIVLKISLLLLTMVKLGYVKKGKLSVSFTSNYIEEFNISKDLLNYYYNLISELTNQHYNQIIFEYDNGSENIISLDDYSTRISIEDISESVMFFVEPNMIWRTPNLNYSFDKKTKYKTILELFTNFFGFKTFKEGQYESICQLILNHDKSLIILPTGGGKSVIYLFKALLSSGVSIIVSPTKLLIKDQILNFNQQFNINNISILDNRDNNLKDKFNHKIVFVEPRVLQRVDIIKSIILQNVNYLISNIFMDEIHSISNWSHNYKTEYLILSHNIKTFMDNADISGFTATANYKIVEDLSRELDINEKNIIAPITFDDTKVEIELIPVMEENELIFNFIKLIKNLVVKLNKESKLIVFTKSEKISKYLWAYLVNNKIFDAEFLNKESTLSYNDFVLGNKTILFATPEMGIGLNLENIRYSIHYGQPTSKSNFVQEIGRVNREDTIGKSFVIFKKTDNFSEQELNIINYGVEVHEIIDSLETLGNINQFNDIYNTFNSIFENLEYYSVSANKILNLYRTILKYKRKIIINYESKNVEMERFIYTLTNLGIVDNWYYRNDKNNNCVIQVELLPERSNLFFVRNRAVTYIRNMGNYEEYINELTKANEISEIIFIIEKWYYHEYIHFHKEQSINMLEFLDYYSDKSSREITLSLSNYFTLSLTKIKDNYNKINSYNINDLFKLNKNEITEFSYFAEILISKEYNYKFDILLFIYYLERRETIHRGRLVRIHNKLDDLSKELFYKELEFLYSKLTDLSKYNLIMEMLEFNNIDKIESIFYKIEKDIVYVSVISTLLNKKLEGI